MSFKHLLELNLKYRWLVLAFFFIFTVVCAFQLPKLRFDFSPEAMLEFSEEEIQYQKDFDKKFSSISDIFLVVVSHEESLLTASRLGDLRELTDSLETFDGVAKTYSLARVPQADESPMALLRGLQPIVGTETLTEQEVTDIRARVRQSALLKGNLISEDEHHALIMVMLKPEAVEPDDFFGVLTKIQDYVNTWQSQNDHAAYKIEYGGLPFIRAMTVDSMKRDQFILWPVVGIIYIVALCVLFRSFWQAVLPLICVGCVVLWAIAIMIWCGIPVTMINNTLPLLILVIGVTNSIYVLMRMMDERKKGKEHKIAVRDGVYRVALATLLTTATTAVGFGSLAVARASILNSFGIITAVAVMLVYVAIIFLMPQAASLIKLDPKTKESADAAKDGVIEKVVSAITDFCIRRKWLVMLGAFVLLAGSIAAGTQVEFNSKVNDVFEEGHPIAQTNLLIEKQLGGMLPLEIDIKADEEQFFGKAENMKIVCDLQARMAAHEGVISTLSFCDLLKEAGVTFDTLPDQTQYSLRLAAMTKLQREQVGQYITSDRNNVHITVRIPDNGVQHSDKTIKDLQNMAAATFDGTSISYRFTGVAYNSTRGIDIFVDDLFNSLMMAFGIIFLLLFGAFRSFYAGITAVIPNVLPLCITLAVIPLYGYGLNTTSVLVFTISIGLAVDNSIHIISRFRQEYRFKTSVEDAIRLAMRSSGRAICQSNILLCVGLAVLFISNFEPIVRVGTLTITTIASSLMISLVVLPAELALLGKHMKLPRFIREEKKLALEADTSSEASSTENDGALEDEPLLSSEEKLPSKDETSPGKSVSAISPALANACISPNP